MITQAVTALRRLFTGMRTGKRWHKRTLVVGPCEPVDGDSVACTKAMINFLRKLGLQAYTLPTITMYSQLAWILQRDDYHPAALSQAHEDFTTDDLQAAYDALLAQWRPDEILLLDGPLNRLGFDPRGVPVYNVDHHVAGQERRDRTAFIKKAPSVGCLLIARYKVYEPILAVSILTDTFWLRQNLPAQAAHFMGILSEHGLTDELLTALQKKLMVPKDPQILQAIHDAEMRIAGDTVFVILSDPRPEIHRGVMAELGYFSRHICVVRPDGYASLKTTDESIDLRPLATKYGGGGHKTIAAAQLGSLTPEVVEALHADFIETVTS